MSQALQVGPLVVPFSLLVMLAAVAAALLVGNRAGRQTGLDTEARVWQTLIVGLVVARLVFVWQYREQYRVQPLDILDVRDGGWSTWGGFAGAWLYVLGLQFRRRAPGRPLYAALATATGVWLAGTAALTAHREAAPRLPDLALSRLEGGQANLAEFVGKPTVVNLWATWCPPCVREMPMLQRAQLDNPAVSFVFVNNREPAPVVDRWLATQRLPLRNVLLDSSGSAAAHFRQRGLPSTLFFDADGRLVSTRLGELSLATLTRELRGLQPALATNR
jgi:thiol-disulfide isomerase/thioredoxin